MNGLGQLHVSAFVLSIREGQVDEYRRRHAAVWPEMLDALRASGVVHYDIHLNAIERKAYGHVLRDRIPDPAAREHPAILRWRAFMADVLEMDGDQPRRDPVEHVFHLTAET
jgi:L-rhamnose mutarotase